MNDAADMALLNTQLGYPSTTSVLTENLEKVLSLTNNIVFVAEFNQRVIGWINIRLVSTIETGTYCEIFGLIVDEARRNKGIGKVLIDKAKKWAKNTGVTKLRVRTNVKRQGLTGFIFVKDLKKLKNKNRWKYYYNF